MKDLRLPGDLKIAIAYLRASTDEQLLSPDAQRACIRTWAVREQVKIADWYLDLGISSVAPVEARPALRNALLELPFHRAGFLVVARRDRIARDVVLAAQIEKISTGALAWKTAASCWTLITSMCADMVSAKKRELRARDDNPCRDVKPPDRGARKAKQYLYPSEFLQFVSCETIPLRWRRAVTLAIYTYTHDGELRVLQWDDLEHSIINIVRVYNRRKPGESKGTKSDASRRFAVEPNLHPLLDAMREESGGKGLISEVASERAMARNFRRWLWKAGVPRPALHETTGQSQNITWHDLRATGATWMAVRGDDPLKIMQRCGHRDYATTQRYVREAEAIREGFGEPFPSLPSCLLEASKQLRHGTLVARAASDNENLAFSRAI